MTIPDQPLYWQVGSDPRCSGRWDENSHGRIRTNDLSIYGYLTLMRQWYQPGNLANVPSNIKPYVVANLYTEDDIGASFPVDTVWIACQNTGEGYAPTVIRTLGDSGVKDVVFSYANPLPVWRGNVPVDVVYYASGLPKGASGSIVIYQGDNTGPVVGSFSVDSVQGPNVVFTASGMFTSGTTIAQGGTTEGYTVESTWNGLFPQLEAISLLEEGANALFFAVPGGSVPSGYTLNPDTGTTRGGSVATRYQADARRAAQQNVHIAHYGLAGSGANCDNKLGLPVFSQLNAAQSIWINDQCQAYTWMPIAIGTKVFPGGSATGGVAGLPPHEFFFNAGGPAITSVGARGGKLTIIFVQGNIGATTLGPQPGDSAVINVLCNGSSVYTTTLSGTGIALSSPMIVDVPSMLPPGGAGSTCTIQVTMVVSGTIAVDGSGHQELEQWTISATLACSPRCDIPFPFTCCNGIDSTLVYPGAYLPSALTGAPQNSQPLTSVSGLSFSVGTTPVALVFSPPSDGWYQVDSSGSPRPGIGEDEFGWASPVTIARGHTGRNFYCLGAASTTYILTPFVPSLTGILSSGTTIDLSAAPAPCFGFGEIVFPGPGAYLVSIKMLDESQALSGLMVRQSKSDPTLLSYDHDRTLIWETLDEFAGTLFSSTTPLNDPPGSPSTTVAVLVGSTPTGVFVGHSDELALWDAAQGLYQFIQASESPFASVAAPYWRYGGTWRTTPDLVLTFGCSAAAAGERLYLGFECFAPGRSTPGRIQVSWTQTP